MKTTAFQLTTIFTLALGLSACEFGGSEDSDSKDNNTSGSSVGGGLGGIGGSSSSGGSGSGSSGNTTQQCVQGCYDNNCATVAGCAALTNCVQQCDSDACVQQCANSSTQTAINGYRAYYSCGQNTCNAQTAGGSSGSNGSGGSTAGGNNSAGNSCGKTCWTNHCANVSGCPELTTCVQQCPENDSSCTQACVSNSTQTALNALRAAINCSETNCSGSSSGSGSSTSASCDSCLTECRASEACVAFVGCIRDCDGNNSCYQQCQNQYPTALGIYGQAVQCWDNNGCE